MSWYSRKPRLPQKPADGLDYIYLSFKFNDGLWITISSAGKIGVKPPGADSFSEYDPRTFGSGCCCGCRRGT